MLNAEQLELGRRGAGGWYRCGLVADRVTAPAARRMGSSRPRLAVDGGGVARCVGRLRLAPRPLRHPACSWKSGRPRQECVQVRLSRFAESGKLLKKIGKVGEGLQPVLLGRFNNAIDNGTGTCTGRRVGEEPVLAADDERFDGPLAAVVIQLQPAVLREYYQFVPLVSAVGNGLPKYGLRQGQ